MSWFFALIGLLVGAAAVVMLIEHNVVAVSGVSSDPDSPAYLSLPTYLSLISVMLTAVTAILAAIAIFIGIIAAYTIRDIRESAKKAVEEARMIANAAKKEAEEGRAEAMKEVKAALSKEAFDERVGAYIRRQKRQTVAELEEDFDEEDEGNR